MAKGRTDSESVVAYCADYDSQNEEEVQETRKLASANANSGAKRSSAALVTGGGTDTAPVHNIDLASDSGYSSRTQATSASADSLASIRQKAAVEHALAAQEFAAPAAPSIHRVVNDGETASQRSGSSTSTKTKKRVVQCAEPNCAKCVEARAKAARKAKPKVTVNTNVSPVKSRQESTAKSSTTTARPKPTVIQSAQPRRRDSQQGPRPTSMYAGSAPPSAYYNRPGYPQSANPGALTIVERPGAVMSARGARGGPRTGPVQYDPQASSRISARRVLKPTVVHTETDGEKMKRQMIAAQKLQAQAEVQPVDDDYSDEDSEEEEDSDYDDEDDYDEEAEEEELMAQEAMRRRMAKQQQPKSAMDEMQQRLAALQMKQAALEEQKKRAQIAEHQRLLLQQQQEAARRQQMPPPTMPASALPSGMQMPMSMSGQMPMPVQMPSPGGNPLSMRRAQPQITYPNRRPSEHDGMDEQLRATLRALTPGPTGSSSTRRPSLASSGGTKATSYSHPGNTHVTVEGGRNGRRMSYMGSEHRDQLESMHAGFQQQHSPDIQSIITQAVQQQLRSLNLTSREPERVQFAMDDKLKNAMQYQATTDHAAQAIHLNRRDTLTDLPNLPLTEAALRRKAGLPSHTGSSRSKRSSDEDASTRISAGHRLTTGSEAGAVTVNGDEMKVRIDTTNGFEMEFEGRLVVLNPIGDGTTAELIIGGKRETSYTSTRGSTVTKSVIGRQPSVRDRRFSRTEYEDDERTERDRRTVYARDEYVRDRERNYRERDYRERDYREERRERPERLERPERPERKDRKDRKDRKERHPRQDRPERQDRRRDNRYEDDDDDYTSDSYTSEEDKRPQRPVRRRAKTYDDKYDRRRAPSLDRRYKDDGAYHYPPGYKERAGFTQQPQF